MVNEIDTEKMVCPCCGRVFQTDKGGIRYCSFCIRYCDANGCYAGKEIPRRGGTYILKEGSKPGIAIYSRCEDALLVRAELLLTMEAMRPEDKDKICWGYYDVDPTFSIEEFLKGYVEEHRMLVLLNKLRQLREHGWKYKREERSEAEQ